MELYITLGAVLIIILLFIAFSVGDEGFQLFGGIVAILFIGSILLWVIGYDRAEVPVEIQTAITDGSEWNYYATDKGVIIPIPNNVDSVIKIERRAGSLEDPEYRIVYK